jgi:hypothetical protein
LSEVAGYILRIATKQWVDQVFDSAIYYTSVNRKWIRGHTILFVHKTGEGDAFIGYGVVENVYARDELSEEERHRCEEEGWTRALEFKYVKELEKPLLVRQSFLKGTKLRGRLLQGLTVTRKQLDATIEQAENH